MNERQPDLKPRMIDVDDAINLLNEILEVSPKTIETMVFDRVECSEELANHQTVQVEKGSSQGFIDGNKLRTVYRVGLLGIINGLFGADIKGWGAIQAVMERDRIRRFERVPHFGNLEPKVDSVNK